MTNNVHHEPINTLSADTRQMHRAITSRLEEQDVVGWYNQQVDACKNEALQTILAKNRDKDKPHATMVIERIRRRDSTMDNGLGNYLFTDKSVTH